MSTHEQPMRALLYLMFFVSGAAALVYEIAWVRSLGLVFGASHLAVTTVLAVYMGGLALGAAVFGRRADRSTRLLGLYGILELGIAAFALVFMGLMKIYPSIYGPLVRLAEDDRVYQTAVRVGFGVIAMLGPTTLMGGTLPVLARFVTSRGGALGKNLSFLYAFNTLGAVAGSLAAGFLLLRTLGMTATLLSAVVVNVLLGLAAMTLSAWMGVRDEARLPAADGGTSRPALDGTERVGELSRHLVLWGIGVSGFCALGYEILWTRILTLVVGTSVYSFTIMLVAFLAGIALGSHAFGLTQRGHQPPGARGMVLAFGAVQLAIGVSALAVTALMRDVPSHANAIQAALSRGAGEFGARQGASFALAFAYMFMPAFFMGVAFPLAGTLHAAFRERVGGAVGEVFTVNTVGAILGAATTGFVLVYAFGTERSLEMLALVNAGLGLTVAASLVRWRAAPWVVGATAALLVVLPVGTSWGRFWDAKYFAIFRNNQRSAFDTPEEVEEALKYTDVLYYSEGQNETISVIRPKGGRQAVIVNGRPEATTSPVDVQCQRTLGHLPMLLHPNPRSVFVLGTGTGMTLGATSLHSTVERMVLAELEPGVLPAARMFSEWNHHVLDDPRLEIFLTDGRTFLATTRERFDVITADPIHPWSGGAAYLYTKEYFDHVAARLNPGGIATQWLPLYELTVRDVKTVVRTFTESFPHVAVWLTHFDAELVGSRAPIVIDEEELARRFARPEVAKDLESVSMGTAEGFLGYFVLGTEGARSFGKGGVVNTDDNLFLEFSAPESQGLAGLTAENVAALAAARESLLPYLAPPAGEADRAAQIGRWTRWHAVGHLYDRAHALFLRGRHATAEFSAVANALEAGAAGYAPYVFLRERLRREQASTPSLVAEASFPVLAPDGTTIVLHVSAVAQHIGDERAVVMFVDNDRRRVFGQRYLDAAPDRLDMVVARFATGTLASVRTAYQRAGGEGPRRAGTPVLPQRDAEALIRQAVEMAAGR